MAVWWAAVLGVLALLGGRPAQAQTAEGGEDGGEPPETVAERSENERLTRQLRRVRQRQRCADVPRPRGFSGTRRLLFSGEDGWWLCDQERLGSVLSPVSLVEIDLRELDPRFDYFMLVEAEGVDLTSPFEDPSWVPSAATPANIPAAPPKEESGEKHELHGGESLTLAPGTLLAAESLATLLSKPTLTIEELLQWQADNPVLHPIPIDGADTAGAGTSVSTDSDLQLLAALAGELVQRLEEPRAVRSIGPFPANTVMRAEIRWRPITHELPGSGAHLVALLRDLAAGQAPGTDGSSEGDGAATAERVAGDAGRVRGVSQVSLIVSRARIARFSLGLSVSALRPHKWEVEGGRVVDASPPVNIDGLAFLGHYWVPRTVAPMRPWERIVPTFAIGVPFTATVWENLYLGLAFEPVRDMHIVGGVHIGRVERLGPGLEPGGLVPAGIDPTTALPTAPGAALAPFVSISFGGDIMARAFRGLFPSSPSITPSGQGSRTQEDE